MKEHEVKRISKGGAGGEIRKQKALMYNNLRAFYQQIDSIPEPQKDVCLTTVRSVLNYLETVQSVINTININM